MLFSIFFAFQVFNLSFGFFLNQQIRNKFVSPKGSILMHGPSVETNTVAGAPYSFVNTDMRAYAMKLHTPQQMKPQNPKTPKPLRVEIMIIIFNFIN